MRLKMFDKIINVLFIVLIACVAAGIVFAAFNTTVLAAISAFLAAVFGSVAYKIIILIVCVIVIFLCIRILFVRQRRNENKQVNPGVPVRSTEDGTTYITLTAIEGIVLKFVQANTKVREVKTTIVPIQDSISIGLKMSLSANTNVPEITAQIQSSLKEHVQNMTGITVREIQIIIESAVGTDQLTSHSKPRVE